MQGSRENTQKEKLHGWDKKATLSLDVPREDSSDRADIRDTCPPGRS